MKIDISVARATEMESMKCMEKERNYCGKDTREIRENKAVREKKKFSLK